MVVVIVVTSMMVGVGIVTDVMVAVGSGTGGCDDVVD